MTDKPAVHWSFWVISAVALIWNALGVMNFFGQMNTEMIADLPDYQQQIIELRPGWAFAAFGVAVFAGVVGSLLLLLRKKLATQLLILSLVGVIVQAIPYIGMDIDFNPGAMWGLILMQVAISGFLIWYAKRAEAKGWTS